MPFQIVSPFVMNINGTDLKSAVKNFVKLHHSLKINNMVVADQNRHVDVALKYYKHDGRNKVGIDMYPSTQIVSATSSIISPFVSPVSSIMSPVSSIMSPVSSIMSPVSSFMSPVSSFMSPVFRTPALKVGKVITPTGPIVGNRVDMGPTLANIVAPIFPTIVASTTPVVTAKGSNIATTANSLIIGNSNILTTSPIAFIPRIVTIN